MHLLRPSVWRPCHCPPSKEPSAGRWASAEPASCGCCPTDLCVGVWGPATDVAQRSAPFWNLCQKASWSLGFPFTRSCWGEVRSVVPGASEAARARLHTWRRLSGTAAPRRAETVQPFHASVLLPHFSGLCAPFCPSLSWKCVKYLVSLFLSKWSLSLCFRCRYSGIHKIEYDVIVILREKK